LSGGYLGGSTTFKSCLAFACGCRSCVARSQRVGKRNKDISNFLASPEGRLFVSKVIAGESLKMKKRMALSIESENAATMAEDIVAMERTTN
jgi:hypothetical protein